jgi:hypothetical protein
MKRYKVWQRIALKGWIKGKKKGFVVKDDRLWGRV